MRERESHGDWTPQVGGAAVLHDRMWVIGGGFIGGFDQATGTVGYIQVRREDATHAHMHSTTHATQQQ